MFSLMNLIMTYWFAKNISAKEEKKGNEAMVSITL